MEFEKLCIEYKDLKMKLESKDNPFRKIPERYYKEREESINFNKNG
jgi:hypothetical protein